MRYPSPLIILLPSFILVFCTGCLKEKDFAKLVNNSQNLAAFGISYAVQLTRVGPPSPDESFRLELAMAGRTFGPISDVVFQTIKVITKRSENDNYLNACALKRVVPQSPPASSMFLSYGGDTSAGGANSALRMIDPTHPTDFGEEFIDADQGELVFETQENPSKKNDTAVSRKDNLVISSVRREPLGLLSATHIYAHIKQTGAVSSTLVDSANPVGSVSPVDIAGTSSTWFGSKAKIAYLLPEYDGVSYDNFALKRAQLTPPSGVSNGIIIPALQKIEWEKLFTDISNCYSVESVTMALADPSNVEVGSIIYHCYKVFTPDSPPEAENDLTLNWGILDGAGNITDEGYLTPPCHQQQGQGELGVDCVVVKGGSKFDTIFSPDNKVAYFAYVNSAGKPSLMSYELTSGKQSVSEVSTHGGGFGEARVTVDDEKVVAYYHSSSNALIAVFTRSGTFVEASWLFDPNEPTMRGVLRLGSAFSWLNPMGRSR